MVTDDTKDKSHQTSHIVMLCSIIACFLTPSHHVALCEPQNVTLGRLMRSCEVVLLGQVSVYQGPMMPSTGLRPPQTPDAMNKALESSLSLHHLESPLSCPQSHSLSAQPWVQVSTERSCRQPCHFRKSAKHEIPLWILPNSFSGH